MKKARRILVVFLIVLIGVVLVGYYSLPREARRPGVEARFQDQLQRLREIAHDTKARWNTSVEGCEADRQLFDRPAILYASVEPIPNSHLIVGNRDFVWSAQFSLPALTSSKARVSRHWYMTSSGIVSAVMYHGEVADKNHNPVGLTLIADISKLEQ